MFILKIMERTKALTIGAAFNGEVMVKRNGAKFLLILNYFMQTG